jgi:hypothetical protein
MPLYAKIRTMAYTYALRDRDSEKQRCWDCKRTLHWDSNMGGREMVCHDCRKLYHFCENCAILTKLASWPRTWHVRFRKQCHNCLCRLPRGSKTKDPFGDYVSYHNMVPAAVKRSHTHYY